MENHHPEQNQLYFNNNEDEEYDEFVSRLPPGYRFVPDDVELIENYLKKIVENPERGRVYGIYTINLYGSSPVELTAAHKAQCENNWYFFTKRNRKYANGTRPSREAASGFWKQTNVIHYIFGVNEQNKPAQIGRKITLDYYFKKGRVESRTDWKMNEYRLDSDNHPDDHCTDAETPAEFDEWSLCRIYKSRNSKPKKDDIQVDLQMEAEPGTQLIVPQQHNEHVAGEIVANFTGQNTAAAFSNQHIIPQEQYNGLYVGGPGPNSVQQSMHLQFNHNGVWNPNYSFYMANVGSGSMNGMYYTSDALLTAYQDSYAITGSMYQNAGYVQPLQSSGSMYENAGYVQPLQSLPPNGVPTWPPSGINQSSSTIPDHVTSEAEFDFSSTDVDFTFDDFKF